MASETPSAALREKFIFESLRTSLGEDLGGGGGLVEILNGIEGLQEERNALKAKLAALAASWDVYLAANREDPWAEWADLCECFRAAKAQP